MGSLILVGLYLLAVVAYLFALGPRDMAMTDTIAATSVSVVLGPWAGKIVALTILISTFSAANSVILTAPRVFYAMANDKLFFKKLAEVHPRFKTPAAAIVGLGVWRSEEHTSELQSPDHLVCRLLLEKKKNCSIQ